MKKKGKWNFVNLIISWHFRYIDNKLLYIQIILQTIRNKAEMPSNLAQEQELLTINVFISDHDLRQITIVILILSRAKVRLNTNLIAYRTTCVCMCCVY